MGEGFIVRRGGGGQQTTKPIYNSLTEAGTNSLTLNVTNDSNSEATLYYSVVNNEPAPDQANTFETEFDGKETKDITITGLTDGTTYTVYIKAIVIGEFPSETVIVSNLATQAIIYTAATGGTQTTYTSGGKRYRSHTFNSNGTFSVTTVGNQDRNQVEYLICAGGGGGGSDNAGGGGGGGVLASGRNNATPITVNAQNYPIGIGAGGRNSGTSNVHLNQNGANSSAFSLTAIGGGRGANGQANSPSVGNGGSGGGGQGEVNQTNGTGGTGTSGQGFNGGTGRARISGAEGAGGGGGGATAAGTNGGSSFGGNGGQGFLTSINNSSRYYGAGGAGGGNNGIGGGGAGTWNGRGVERGGSGNSGGTGQANSGGGGGGSSATGSNGGAGGSGIVVIRYEIAPN